MFGFVRVWSVRLRCCRVRGSTMVAWNDGWAGGGRTYVQTFRDGAISLLDTFEKSLTRRGCADGAFGVCSSS